MVVEQLVLEFFVDDCHQSVKPIMLELWPLPIGDQTIKSIILELFVEED